MATTKKEVRNLEKRLGSAAVDLNETLHHLAEEAGQNVREFIHDKSVRANELRETAEEEIRSHPLKAVAIAAIGGLILGALLKR